MMPIMMTVMGHDYWVAGCGDHGAGDIDAAATNAAVNEYGRLLCLFFFVGLFVSHDFVMMVADWLVGRCLVLPLLLLLLLFVACIEAQKFVRNVSETCRQPRIFSKLK